MRGIRHSRLGTLHDYGVPLRTYILAFATSTRANNSHHVNAGRSCDYYCFRRRGMRFFLGSMRRVCLRRQRSKHSLLRRE